MYKILGRIFYVLLLGASAADANTLDVRDPTTPLGHVKAGAASIGEQHFTLNSILISSQRKLAIINGSTLREGQVVPGSDNVSVRRISGQMVVLQQADKVWELRLSPSIVKRH